MEEMSDYRNQLIEQRERQLAVLREKTGKFEQFTFDCACAAHDRDFRAVFVKRPPASRYVCEKTERISRPSVFGRLQGVLSGSTPKTPPKTFNVEEADFGFPCEYCGSKRWTLCSQCGAFVCGRETKGNQFRCRASCGQEFTIAPLTEFVGSTGWSRSDVAAIGHQRTKLLPGALKRIEGARQ
jgi:hypothetical protein